MSHIESDACEHGTKLQQKCFAKQIQYCSFATSTVKNCIHCNQSLFINTFHVMSNTNNQEAFEIGSFKGTIQGKTVLVQCDSRLEAQAAWLLKTIEDVSEESNDPIRDNWTLELGFSVVILIERDGMFVVCEPDFDEDPFESVVEDVSRSLWVVVMQNEIGETTGTSEHFKIPRFDETVVLRKGALEEERIFLQRDEAEPSDDDEDGEAVQDSGWYIGGADDEDDDEDGGDDSDDKYEACYVYQLLESRPMALSVMALPVGYVAVLDGEDIEAIYDEEDENVWHPDEDEEESK